jgi:glycosyltransferase involved in cell wall biosynthesis
MEELSQMQTLDRPLPPPKVSVIIPTYNRAGLIGKAIASVLNQTDRDWEIIVVDDCSTDDTQQVLTSFDDPRIRYIRHASNSGVAIARNTGINSSQSPYIAFLDSDDAWLPEKLARQIQLFEQCAPEVGFIYTGFAAVDESDRVKRTISSSHRGNLRARLLYSNFIGTPSTVMVKREYLDRVNGFDPKMSFEDWDLWFRLSEHCQFETIPDVLVLYAYNDAGDRRTLNHQSAIEGCLGFIQKHHHPSTFNPTAHQQQLSHRDLAEYLFDTGRTLICNGFVISHPEAISVGRLYHLLSFRANFLHFKALVYYAVSLFGGNAYLSLLESENELRSQVKRLLNKDRVVVQ